jgi:hypothetical protein
VPLEQLLEAHQAEAHQAEAHQAEEVATTAVVEVKAEALKDAAKKKKKANKKLLAKLLAQTKTKIRNPAHVIVFLSTRRTSNEQH